MFVCFALFLFLENRMQQWGSRSKNPFIFSIGELIFNNNL